MKIHEIDKKPYSVDVGNGLLMWQNGKGMKYKTESHRLRTPPPSFSDAITSYGWTTQEREDRKSKGKRRI